MQKLTRCPAEYLPPHVRTKLVKVALNEGYAVKDLAEIMGVSSAAVSRYIHGTLSPSVESVCRLIYSVDDSVRVKIMVEIALELLEVISNILEEIGGNDIVLHALENLADRLSSIMIKASTKEKRGEPF